MRPAEALRRHLAQGSTGSLVTELAGEERVAVYVMQGEILAAESPSDGIDLVQRLVARETVTRDQGRLLLERLVTAAQVGDVLFGTIPDDIVMDLYGQRFRENLCRFLLGSSSVEFSNMESIQVENVQVGHDSQELLDGLAARVERVRALLAQLDLVVLEPGDVAASDKSQACVAAVLQGPARLKHVLEASPYEATRALDLVVEMLDAGVLRRSDVGSADLPIDEDGPSVVDNGELAMFADREGCSRRSGDGQFTVSRDLLDTVDLSDMELVRAELETDEIFIEMEEGTGDEEGVSLSFGSPTLTNEEAIRKIAVTSEVLREIASALDEEQGPGSGQASVQLLVESAPSELAFLFAKLESQRDGGLDLERLLVNLDERPESERRPQLNRAMNDLIERGFTHCMERISEERLEAMLERIAGYQKRLGL